MKTAAAKKSTPEFTTISSTLTGQKGQKGCLVEVLSHGTRRLRITIECDSYVFQSHAKISLWNGTAWEMVHTIAGAAMKTAHKGYHPAGFSVADFAADRAELLRIALAVIS